MEELTRSIPTPWVEALDAAVLSAPSCDPVSKATVSDVRW